MSALVRSIRGLLVAMALLAPGVAWGHATLVSSDPADGAVAAAAPGRVVLLFNEPVSPLTLRLTNPIGETSALTDILVPGGGRVVVTLPQLGQGTHVMSYRVVSADGHPIGGALIFSVGHPTANPAAAAEAGDPLVRALVLAARMLIYAGLFFGVGGCFFAAWVVRGPLPAATMRLIHAGIIAGAAAAALSIGLQGLDALALPVTFILQRDVWITGITTSYGLSATTAILAFVVAFGRSGDLQVRTLIAFAGIGFAFAASGHASSAEPQWLTRPLVFIHVLAVAFWAGALISLRAVLADGAAGQAALMRFSRAIPGVLVVLALAGFGLAVIQIGDFDALATSGYGFIFTLKMLAVIALIVVAAFNRFVLTQSVIGSDAGATRQLRAAIVAEVVLVAAILLVVAFWRFTPPPRALALQNTTSAMVHIHTEKTMADVWITPGRAGPVEASINLLNHDFGALDAKEVTLELSNPGAGIEPILRPARKTNDGRWTVDNLIIPAPGRWKVRIDILISDFEKIAVDAEMQFRP